jgi:hypothetical protein
LTRRYGFYGYRGIDTIGHPERADATVTSALQVRYQNELLSGEVVEAGELAGRCGSNHSAQQQLCLWVHWDGRVETAK